MQEQLRNAKEELKRVDHLIYVSLKYTRTVDVIHNVLERLISSFGFIADSLLQRAVDNGDIEEIPKAPRLKCETLEELYPEDDKILVTVKEYLMLRQIIQSKYDKENEYRRHVAMIVKIDKDEVRIDIDQVTEYYKRYRELIEHIEHSYND